MKLLLSTNPNTPNPTDSFSQFDIVNPIIRVENPIAGYIGPLTLSFMYTTATTLQQHKALIISLTSFSFFDYPTTVKNPMSCTLNSIHYYCSWAIVGFDLQITINFPSAITITSNVYYTL
jgi:hypothetical protein